MSWLRSPWGRAALIAAGYAVVAGAYITLSTEYLGHLSLGVADVVQLELVKGLAFVVVTSTLLAVVLGAMLQRRDRLREVLLRRSAALSRGQAESGLRTAVRAVAHDMKNMLMALEATHAELAGAEGPPARHREALDDMGQAIARLRSQTGDLLEQARGTARPFEPEDVDVASLVHEVARMARLFAPRGKSRIHVSARRGSRVRADRRSLQMALLNLMVNAIDATGERGHVWIRVEGTDPVRIIVADQGPGVPAHLRDRVFDPFYTTKHGGTGLGLPVVRAVADELRGRIEVADAPAGGAEFRLSLPAAPVSMS